MTLPKPDPIDDPKEQSALGELIDIDFETVPLMNLYRVSDQLIRHHDAIEKALFGRLNDLFSLPTTVTLYDLTNTYFEGELHGNAKAQRVSPPMKFRPTHRR